MKNNGKGKEKEKEKKGERKRKGLTTENIYEGKHPAASRAVQPLIQSTNVIDPILPKKILASDSIDSMDDTPSGSALGSNSFTGEFYTLI